MDFEQAVAYMSGLIRFGWKLDLDRMTALCERLGNPQHRYRVVHVAGTKGKGSTTALCAAILRAHGFRVGGYFSPYVYDVRERIQVDGEPISRDAFAMIISRIRPLIEELAETEFGQTTEFELKTAAAFCYFAEQEVDFACIEVGIGGRLDATNVVQPAATVITNIGLDHTEILGDTHAAIAAEKAGILKTGVPCVTATANPEALAVIEQVAAERGVALTLVRRGPTHALDSTSGRAALAVHTAGRIVAHEEGMTFPRRDANPVMPTDVPEGHVDEGRKAKEFIPSPTEGRGYPLAGAEDLITSSTAVPEHRQGPVLWEPERGREEFGAVTVATPARVYPDLAIRMGGAYQRENAACAIAAAEIALSSTGRSLEIDPVRTALAEVALPGRLTIDRRAGGPLVVLDGAHNALAAEALRPAIDALRREEGIARTVLVVGMVGGHSPEGVLSALAPGVARIIACRPAWKRAQPAETIAEAARAYCDDVQVIEYVPDAVRAAITAADRNTLVLVTGSFYTVGEVRID